MAFLAQSDHPSFEDGLLPAFGTSAVLPADEFDIKKWPSCTWTMISIRPWASPRTGVRRYYSRLVHKRIDSEDWLRQMYYSYEGNTLRIYLIRSSKPLHRCNCCLSQDTFMVEINSAGLIDDFRIYNVWR